MLTARGSRDSPQAAQHAALCTSHGCAVNANRVSCCDKLLERDIVLMEMFSFVVTFPFYSRSKQIVEEQSRGKQVVTGLPPAPRNEHHNQDRAIPFPDTAQTGAEVTPGTDPEQEEAVREPHHALHACTDSTERAEMTCCSPSPLPALCPCSTQINIANLSAHGWAFKYEIARTAVQVTKLPANYPSNSG